MPSSPNRRAGALALLAAVTLAAGSALGLTVLAALVGLAGLNTGALAGTGDAELGLAQPPLAIAAGGGQAGAGQGQAAAQEPSVSDPVTLIPGSRAILLADGYAAAPAAAPAAVRAMIAAGNQIVGRPYVYGGGHGVPLSVLAPSYDCSSSVSHLLYGGGLLPADADMTSGELEQWGLPGPGRWVSIYANPDHVYMYVAGLRWDTWNAAGPGDGPDGIGWHPLVRSAAGFVVRHPAGL